MRRIFFWAALSLAIVAASAQADNLLLLGVGGPPAGGGGTCCTFVNTVYAEDASGASATTLAAAALNVTGGNLLVAFCRSGGAVTPTVSDTASNTFTQIDNLQDAQVGSISSFYAKNVTGNASDVVTCNYGSSVNFRSVDAIQYSGASTTVPLDQHTKDPASPSSAGCPVSSSITTTAANEVLVASVNDNAAGITWTAGTGFTLKTTNPTLTGVEDKLVTAIQTGITIGMTEPACPNSNFWTILTATFK